MTYRLLTQITIIILTVCIFVFYVQPRFIELKQVEVEIEKYKDAVSSVEQVNNTLQALVNEAGTISQAELLALDTYLPLEVDEVTVLKDIETIAVRNTLRPTAIAIAESADDFANDSVNVQYDTGALGNIQYDENGEPIEVQYDENGVPIPQDENAALRMKLVKHTFSFTAEGRYSAFVQFLREIENNIYPLKVVALDIKVETTEEGASDVYTYDLELETYSYNSI